MNFKEIKEVVRKNNKIDEKDCWIVYSANIKKYLILNTARKEWQEREFGDSVHQGKVFRWSQELEDKYIINNK